MGTPEFSIPTLTSLLAAGHEVVAVYTQPPRPSGRGHKVNLSPVHDFAEKHGLPVFTPQSLRNPDEQVKFSKLSADLAVVVAYGLILPQAILDAPRFGCINVHASLLPRWRGAAPIQRAVMAGDMETGITIMQMDAGLDTGEMLATEHVPIASAKELHETLSVLGASMLVSTINNLANIIPIKQPLEDVTYANKIEKSEGRIEWGNSAQDIVRQVKALTPWPGVWFEYQGARVKVSELIQVEEEGNAGLVLHDLTIACGTGAVRLLTVQPESKKSMTAEEFLRGHHIPSGSYLD